MLGESMEAGLVLHYNKGITRKWFYIIGGVRCH